MKRPRSLAFATAALALAGAAHTQEFPARPIQVLTSEPGGANDFGIRVLSQVLSTTLGKQVVVVNRGGGGGVIAAEIVAKATPDGYTLLYFGSNIWMLPFLRGNLPYDPIRDFTPVTLVVTSPIIVVAHPGLPVESVKDLIALAKAKPGALNYARASAGGPTHLAAELFNTMAGIRITSVPYKGAGPGLTAVMAGELQLAFGLPSGVLPHIKSGRLKALAVTSAQPSALLPGLPTVAATGLPGYEASAVAGVFAPARVPPAIVARLNQELVAALRRPEVRERFLNVGEEAVGSTQAEFGARVKSDMSRLGKLIKDAGIRAD
ncbi:MAG: tripartite tricarboxylate transporter substrate binding protein [Burkholderiales bacterium]|nr:tripartite tricarboxylate transporter substrate binding protein [Burkholderiales bacterium]